jgi:hypothetical protein
MGDSIAEMNSSYLASRAATLNSAITTALASKDGGASQPQGQQPSGSRPAKAAPAAAAAPAAPASTVEPPASGTGAAGPAEASQPSTDGEGEESQRGGEEPPGAPPEGEGDAAPAPELAALTAAGKKKDLRALEKALGLPEGHLGVQNHDYAAYRRRQDELATDQQNLTNAQNILIERYAPHVKALQLANKGDLRGYADLIQLQTGVGVEDFVKYWSANVQQLPPEVAEFQAEKRRKLQQQSAAPPETKQEPAADKPTTEQATARADKYISEEAGNHPAFKLEGAKEGVRKIWLASYDKATKGFKLSPQQAANEFVKQRKAAYEREQWILSGKQPPAPARTRTPARRGQAEAKPPSDAPLTREQLIERGAQEWRRQKARDRA